jgi:hypothetical protein
MTVPESDKVAAHEYRLAQARRLLRYCREIVVDPKAVLDGTVKVDLRPIHGADGKIAPEAVDFLG